ncbi:hypothetical protein [Borrelia turicatae]|nr:hypothetical protein [Borrelia turicatae]
MSNLIRFILYITSLLLYCCKGYKVSIVSTEAQPHNSSKRAMDNLQTKTD